jgi:hypothetical protein
MPMQLIEGVDTHKATLNWLDSTLEHARSRSQMKLLGYMEAVLDEVVFEMESAACRSRCTS